MERRYLVGIVLIVTGIIMTGQKMGFWTVSWQEWWSNWWPLLLIAAGLISLTRGS